MISLSGLLLAVLVQMPYQVAFIGIFFFFLGGGGGWDVFYLRISMNKKITTFKGFMSCGSLGDTLITDNPVSFLFSLLGQTVTTIL